VPTLEEQVVKYLTDAHSLEQQVSRQLDTMIQTTENATLRAHMEHHKEETEHHKELLERRLADFDASPSVVKEAGQILGAMGAAATNLARKDNAGKNARDAFVAEHLEIASYELLERVAQFAGDHRTVELARQIRADEEAMAAKIASSWDLVAMESLRAEGIESSDIAARIPGGDPRMSSPEG
jgi:ferritin-like metal-binding protein YciE